MAAQVKASSMDFALAKMSRGWAAASHVHQRDVHCMLLLLLPQWHENTQSRRSIDEHHCRIP